MLLASFKLPIVGFDDNRFCDISVFEVEVKGRGPVFSGSETQMRFAAHAHPIDDTLPKEFDEIFNEVAAVQHPPGRFGSNMRERLLALLAERVQKSGELVVEENSEDGKPQTLSLVAYIMAYREFDFLLGDMLNESRFGGDVSTPNVTPNPPLAQQEPGDVWSINPLGKHVDEATPIEVLRWVETAAERLLNEAARYCRVSRYDREQGRIVSPPIPDTDELRPVIRKKMELMAYIYSWPKLLVGFLVQCGIENDRAMKEVDDLIQSFSELFNQQIEIEETEFGRLLSRCTDSLNSFRQSADLFRGRWSARELHNLSDCTSVGVLEPDGVLTSTNGGQQRLAAAKNRPSQTTGSNSADLPEDGPVPPDGFCWEGKFCEGMTAMSWQLISFLWPRKNRSASDDDLAPTVWPEVTDVSENSLGSARREANHFFRENSFPWSVVTQRHPSTQGRRLVTLTNNAPRPISPKKPRPRNAKSKARRRPKKAR